ALAAALHRAFRALRRVAQQRRAHPFHSGHVLRMRFARAALPALVVVAMGALGVGGEACSSEPNVSAIRITSLDQAIGGPVANARTGDFLLKNDQIMVV